MTRTFIVVANDNRPSNDFALSDHGTIIMFHPLTAEAQQWWDENVNEGPSFGNAYAVEHRYVMPLVEGIEAEGFTIAE